MPLAAYGRQARHHGEIAPLGRPVYQAGTLSWNPSPSARASRILKELTRALRELERLAAGLEQGPRRLALISANFEVCVPRLGLPLSRIFSNPPAREDLSDASRSPMPSAFVAGTARC